MSDDDTVEGLGGDAKLSRGDLNLFRRALRQDWAIDPEVKQMLIKRAVDLCDPSTKAGKKIPHRTLLAAIKVLGQLGNLSVKQQALDLARQKQEVMPLHDPDTPTAADVVRDMAAAAERYERDHPDDDGPPGDRGGAGEVPGEAGEVQRDDPGEG